MQATEEFGKIIRRQIKFEPEDTYGRIGEAP
jgi:hypothetical protein